jgi:hypothetical protein
MEMPKTLEKKPAEKTRKNAPKVARKARPEPIEETVAVAPVGPTCAHHWVIATPNGETSVGRCKVCGLEKEFPNSADDYLWERSVPQSRWTGRADSSSSFSNGF